MHLLENAIKDYAWGSNTMLAEFMGHEPPGGPEAELWMGAHHAGPSRLSDGRLLNDAIFDEPVPIIGRRVQDIFGDRMPFLMKILAVNEALSLQVHPSGQRALIGYRREQLEDIPIDAPHRNYKDQWHKPELIYALTPFEGLAGFREIEKTTYILRLLNLKWADDVAYQLESAPAFQALRDVVTEILHMDGKKLKRTLREVNTAATHLQARLKREQLRHRAHRAHDPLGVFPEAIRSFGKVAELCQVHPTDPGVLVTLLLNYVALSPGQSMFLNAGVVHAYLSGFGVEIMASSDNVLRAGLTPKHMDKEELLAITNFTPIPPPRWDPAERTDTFTYLEPPVAEFGLTVGKVPLRRLQPTGPRVVLVLDGEVTLRCKNGEEITARRGQSVLLAHDDGAVEMRGDAEVAVGSVPA